MILYESGINLKIKDVAHSLGSTLLLTILVFFGHIVIIYFFCHYIAGLSRVASVMTGALLCGTSSAIVIPMIRQIKMHDKSQTLLLMESAINDVLCLVGGLTLFSAMQNGFIKMNELLSDIMINFFLSTLIGIIAGLIWSVLLNKIRQLQNSLFITAAYLFIVYGITVHFKLNGGISTLVMGITLGNISIIAHLFNRYIKILPESVNETEKIFFGELVFVFATYFFVYIGISMKFSSLYVYILAIIITMSLVAMRYFFVNIIIKSEDMKPDKGIIFSVAPKGLVAAILASMPLQAGLPGGEFIQNISFAVIFISIVISSILVFIRQTKKKIEKPLYYDI